MESYQDKYKVTKIDIKLKRWIESYQDRYKVKKMDRKLPKQI